MFSPRAAVSVSALAAGALVAGLLSVVPVEGAVAALAPTGRPVPAITPTPVAAGESQPLTGDFSVPKPVPLPEAPDPVALKPFLEKTATVIDRGDRAALTEDVQAAGPIRGCSEHAAPRAR